MRTFMRDALRLMIVAVVLGSVGACGLNAQQRTAIAGYSKAGAKVAQSVEAALPKARRHKELMALRRLQLAELEGRGPGKLSPPVDHLDLDGDWDRERITKVVAAANLLKDYAALLAALGADDESKKVDEAAQSLEASLGDLGSKAGISEDQAGSISKAVKSVGKWALNLWRKSELKDVVNSSQYAIDSLTNTLAEDFDPGVENSLAYDVDAAGGDLAVEAAGALLTLRGARPTPDRADAIGRAYEYHYESRKAQEFAQNEMAAIAAAFRKAGKAHRALAKVINDSGSVKEQIKAIIEFGKAVGAIYSATTSFTNAEDPQTDSTDNDSQEGEAAE